MDMKINKETLRRERELRAWTKIIWLRLPI